MLSKQPTHQELDSILKQVNEEFPDLVEDLAAFVPEGIPQDLYFEGLEITGDHDLAISYAHDMMKDD